MNNIEEIKLIKNDIKDLLKSIDDLEIEIIQQNIHNNNKIELYKSLMENVIIEYHDVCKKIFSN
jgi:hypothetical protein